MGTVGYITPPGQPRPGKTIAVYIEADQARAIERLAKRDYLSKSAVVRAALRFYLAVHAATEKDGQTA